MDWSINPNPAYYRVIFKLTHSISKIRSANIEIFDTAGKLVKNINATSSMGGNEIITEWNIRSERSIITDGVYLCRAKIEKGDGEITFSNLEKLVILK